ncbi:hypothetical protein, partial [Actinocorallia lasiicapitis]
PAADEALAVLIGLRDPRAARLLARDLHDRPEAVRAVEIRHAHDDHECVQPLVLRDDTEFLIPFDRPLLESVRAELRAVAAASRRTRRRRAPRWPVDLDTLLGLLHSWGPDAHEARAELALKLPITSRRRAELLFLLAPTPRERTAAATRLRDLLERSTPYGRVEDAHVYWRLTADPGPILGEIRRAFAEKIERYTAARTLLALGGTARPLVPELRTLLLSRKPAKLVRDGWGFELATAYWRLTADPEPLLPLLKAARKDPWDSSEACALIREMGPAAAPLAPWVARQAAERHQPAEEVLALTALHPDGAYPPPLTAERLITRLVRPLRREGTGSFARRSLDAIAELGIAHATPGSRRALHRLVGSDTRTTSCVAEDESLRTEAEAVLWPVGGPTGE